MNIYSIGMAGGSQRFNREQARRKASGDPDFGTVMTGEELQQWVDGEIRRNQGQKKTPADGEKDSRPDGGSDSEVITRPDGSKILMITNRIGNMESVTGIKLSEPSVFPPDGTKADTLEEGAVRGDALRNKSV
ncbi:MAG: hypothetical protein NC341_07260 [Blautia sp.]|nr:hypothetical protein [Blautia sp.]MCM1199736.1 hypothetical protein [Bacteroides fragilis]